MKKIDSYKDLEVGKVYNKVYKGSNKAHAKISGKQTIRIIQTTPNLLVEILFDELGSIFSDELANGPVTHLCPEVSFKEYDLFEIEDESEYFIKAQRMTLQEAFDANLITLDEIRKSNHKVIAVWHEAPKENSFYYKFDVEGRLKENPYLQSVFVEWDSYKERDAAFEEFGIIEGCQQTETHKRPGAVVRKYGPTSDPYNLFVSVAEKGDTENSKGSVSHVVGSDSVTVRSTLIDEGSISVDGKNHLARMRDALIAICKIENIE